MKISGFGYLLKQGAKNVWINRLMSIACIGVMTACLLIVGASMLVSLNITRFMGYIESQNEVVVFVEQGVNEAGCSVIEKKIASLDNVDHYTYISSAQALEAERENFGEYADLLDGITPEENPLPASFRVVLKNLETIEESLTELRGLQGIEKVDAPVEMSNTIVSLKNIVMYAGGAVVILLLVVSLVIIANTVKITVFNHRREINIMKYCGATDTYIRLPYLVEGTIIGVIAALLSYSIIFVLYQRGVEWIAQNEDAATGFLQSLADQLLPFSTVAFPMLLIFLAFGLLVGLLGSVVFVKKYLKV